MTASLNEAQRSVVDTLRAHWRLYVFEGVVMIVLGVLAIVFPVFATPRRRSLSRLAVPDLRRPRTDRHDLHRPHSWLLVSSRHRHPGGLGGPRAPLEARRR